MADTVPPRADVELTEEVERLLPLDFEAHESQTIKDAALRDRRALAQKIAAAVERILADRLAAVLTEVLVTDSETGEHIEAPVAYVIAALTARAESAEAERDDLRARLLAVEELAELWDRDDERDMSAGWASDRLRAVLASPSTHTQQDTETAERIAQAIEAEASRSSYRDPYAATEAYLNAATIARADSLATGEGQ